MKRILIISLLFISPSIYGQLITADPAVFTAEDEVTIRIDVSANSNASIIGYSGDVWAWAFISQGCAADCDAPSNVNPAGGEETDPAKMIRDPENQNVYTITFTPTDFFNKPPGEIREIGFVLKASDWGQGIQTQNIYITVTPLEFIPSQNRVFPSKFTQEDVITIYFDQEISTDRFINNLEEVYVFPSVDIVRADGSFEENVLYVSEGELVNTPELKMNKAGTKLFSLTMIPENFFGLEEGDRITSITYDFRNVDGSRKSSDTFEIVPLSID